ncbi:MAG: O-methyltransferase involved in polyketide biosynthesis [Bacillariaceae sp.]|jgi:O-methyltransferase involved in polyketide biosynthesis
MIRPAILTVALFAIVVGNYYYNIRGTGGGGYFCGDGTAQGAAKIRHYESLHEPSSRLYNDPYAQYMYPGSFAQTWLGETGTRRLYNFIFKGLIEMITLRTKWLDDEIMKAIQIPQAPQRPTDNNNENNNDNDNKDEIDDETGVDYTGAGAEQMIILGVGYDTRGFRLDLPDTFRVIEIDQPDVQALKIKKLVTIAKTDERILSRIMKTNKTKNNNIVQFIGIDFNKGGDSSISDKLLSSNVFNKNKVTIVILEGVTQYLPKSSTADTLRQLHTILPANSILLISYVPQDAYDDPNKLCGGGGGDSSNKSTTCAKKINLLLKSSNLFAGEPWITGWTSTNDFRFFLMELGYKLHSVSTVDMLNDKYLKPLNRNIKKGDMVPIEQYAVAIVVK